MQNFNHNIGFWEKRHFFAEKCRKSQIIVTITLTPGRLFWSICCFFFLSTYLHTLTTVAKGLLCVCVWGGGGQQPLVPFLLLGPPFLKNFGLTEVWTWASQMTNWYSIHYSTSSCSKGLFTQNMLHRVVRHHATQLGLLLTLVSF
jgi:hypothetical protein